MGVAWSGHDAGKFQFNAPSLDPVNQASASPEYHRHEGDCQLVEEARRQALLHDHGPHEAHIFPLASPPGLGDRFLDAGGDEL
jgi:hypothetical protein